MEGRPSPSQQNLTIDNQTVKNLNLGNAVVNVHFAWVSGDKLIFVREHHHAGYSVTVDTLKPFLSDSLKLFPSDL